MTARVLAVDDEPDRETLIVQRFRRQIRDGSFSFCFAEDGVTAVAMLAASPGVDMVVSDAHRAVQRGSMRIARWGADRCALLGAARIDAHRAAGCGSMRIARCGAAPQSADPVDATKAPGHHANHSAA